jgi:hypothetical protein
MKKYCVYCGAANDSNSGFCCECGKEFASLGSNAAAAPPQPPPPQQQPPQPQPPPTQPPPAPAQPGQGNAPGGFASNSYNNQGGYSTGGPASGGYGQGGYGQGGPAAGGYGQGGYGPGGGGYIGTQRSAITIILLSIVTCGIYMYYWLYKTMEDINNASGEKRFDSTLMLILCIFISPVMFYVWYKIDKELNQLSAREGLHYEEKFIMWLLLSLVCGVGAFLMLFNVTDALNSIWARRSGGYAQGNR